MHTDIKQQSTVNVQNKNHDKKTDEFLVYKLRMAWKDKEKNEQRTSTEEDLWKKK